MLGPTAHDVRFLAATPDGTRVAYPVDSDPTPASGGPSDGPARIDLVALATGHHETFQTTFGGRVSTLSWDPTVTVDSAGNIVSKG